MSDQLDLSRIIDRLRANLRAAGIRVNDADIDGIAAKGFLRNILACEAIFNRTPSDLLPDYLSAWGEENRVPPIPAHEGTSDSAASASERHPGHPTISDVAQRVERREVSPVELTEQALELIAKRDPHLNAFQVVLASSARETAQAAEAEIAGGRYRGPLHGVPIAVKDLFAMKGTITTAGSKILAEWETDFDAAVVERLRAAGAVIVGKTRMSEFAYSPASNNAHYGPTRNPWNAERDTGGSSSGSGAAVADGLVFGALGSDTGGSIRMPAALCGIVGLKPTFGRNSLYGAVTLSWSLDHVGPMTRSVRDAAIMQLILAGHDDRDLRTRKVLVPDYVGSLDRGVNGLKVGVIRSDGSDQSLATDEVLTAWRAGLETLASAGAELIELDLPELNELRSINGCIIAMEATAYHEPMLRERPEDFGEFAYQRLISSYAYAPNALARAEQARTRLRQRMNGIFANVDLLSTPTMPYGAPPLEQQPRNTWYTGPFNSLGWPAITVPVGLGNDRLPLAMQIVARPWDEETVFRAAAVVEAAGPWPGGMP